MTHLIIDLSEADLLARMRNFEDHLVERKTVKDDKDWKKTVVAFANSAPIGLPAVLYIGVRDSGEIEAPQRNLDEAQKKFNAIMEKVYPPIAYITKIVNDKGLQAVAVIIPGSELKPHFAGLAYIRRGSETRQASDEQFSELIAQRNSKANRILQWKGKSVSVITRTDDSETLWPTTTLLVDCNQFYVTIEKAPTEPYYSFPLSRVEVNFDNLRSRLQLEIADQNRNLWEMELERHVRQVLTHSMTLSGQVLMRQLLLHGKIECQVAFIPEIPMEVQTREMDIAVKNAIVRRQEETTGLRRTYFVVNPDYWTVLKKVLPQVIPS